MQLSPAFRQQLLARTITEPRLLLGCSSGHPSDWIALDFDWGLQPDIVQDVRQGLPFLDNSISAVYLRYVLEYLENGDGGRLLRECFRVMKPGAPLRLAARDLELFARRYVRRNRRFFSGVAAVDGGPEDASEAWLTTLYGWGRRCAYDWRLIRQLLEDTGFTTVARERYSRSRYEEFTGCSLDDRPQQSLFVEAVKPRTARH